MSNELGEQQYAVPEQDLRTATLQIEPANETEPAPRDDAAEPAPQEASNDGAGTAPVIRLVDNRNFKTFTYGEDDSKFGLQKNTERQPDPAENAVRAIRNDISLIAVGASQIRANQTLATRQAGNDDAHHHSIRGQQELSRQQAEQRRVEAWNNTQVVMGGVSMNQEQALNALQKINQSPDAFAKRAVEEGRIKKGEEEEYKRTAKRMQELMEKDKAGKLSPEELKERTQLESSTMGQVLKTDIGNKVQMDRMLSQNNNLPRTGTSYSPPPESTANAAPAVSDIFTAAVQNRQVIAQADTTPAIPAINTDQVKKNNASIPGMS